jgi:hypothetical protein
MDRLLVWQTSGDKESREREPGRFVKDLFVRSPGNKKGAR